MGVLGLVVVVAMAAPLQAAPPAPQRPAPPTAVKATPPPTSSGLAAFETAWQRVRDGQPDQVDPPALQRLPIYPYLVAARLSRDLTGPDAAGADVQIAAFLRAHAGYPVTRRLAVNWLRSLAQRHDWPTFLAHYDASRADADLRCRWFEARIATGDTTGLAPLVGKAYLTARNLDACNAAFAWLAQQGQLPASVVARRAQLALAARNVALARRLAKRLPAAQAARIDAWAALVADPVAALPKAVAHRTPAITVDALRAGFSRLVRRNVDAALKLYPQLLEVYGLHGADAEPFTRLLALGLAWSRQPQALHYFEQLQVKSSDTLALEWRVRAALWAGDWQGVHDWIIAFPAALRSDEKWQYWLARADSKLGEPDAARMLYAPLADGSGYYALLASWRLDRGYTPTPRPLIDHPAVQVALAAWPGLVRAHELFQVGLPSLAGVEWTTALANATRAQRLQAVRLAYGWGWYEQAVATAARQGVFSAYDLLYPRPFAQAVGAAASANQLPRDWIYAVTRQESLFNARAVSSSGALGLMQLMPATARAVVRRHQLAVPTTRAALFVPHNNLQLGATYLRGLLNREGGAFIVALAGYNAGYNAAERWLPAKPLAADIWIENIPYTETRRYIKRILWHVAVFGWEASGKPQNISPLLAPVGGAAA
ncbi:MAG TPA: transglycosylase SLT domain-containing protein [Nevskiaceae bacterium]|nr:transglycosylase SLT domain-containing protein [Nevskiaceae bacterium]